MKIAMIGYGKMGRTIEQLASKQGHEVVLKINADNLDAFTTKNLQQADVAITTSISSQIAQASSDIVIHEGGIEKILNIRDLAVTSSRRVRQNLFLAFVYNSLMIPIAVAGSISPKLGALAMAMSSISVVLNSSRKLTN